MKCIKEVKQSNKSCDNKTCRYWISYSEDLNCSMIAIEKNGSMKLHQVGERLQLTAARVKQLESEICKKLSKYSNILNILE